MKVIIELIATDIHTTNYNQYIYNYKPKHIYSI